MFGTCPAFYPKTIYSKCSHKCYSRGFFDKLDVVNGIHLLDSTISSADIIIFLQFLRWLSFYIPLLLVWKAVEQTVKMSVIWYPIAPMLHHHNDKEYPITPLCFFRLTKSNIFHFPSNQIMILIIDDNYCNIQLWRVAYTGEINGICSITIT